LEETMAYIIVAVAALQVQAQLVLELLAVSNDSLHRWIVCRLGGFVLLDNSVIA
jgi:hypothetical protein